MWDVLITQQNIVAATQFCIFLFFTIEFLRISTLFFKPDDKQACDKYEFTTTAEVSDDDDDKENEKQKAIRRKNCAKG